MSLEPRCPARWWPFRAHKMTSGWEIVMSTGEAPVFRAGSLCARCGQFTGVPEGRVEMRGPSREDVRDIVQGLTWTDDDAPQGDGGL